MSSLDGKSPVDRFAAARTLMGGLIDYAGLFPPAKLDMPTAVERYAEYLSSPHAWMLGRFILPVSRIEEFRKAATSLLPHARSKDGADEDPQPWLISAIVDGDLDENIDSIFAFNHEHAHPAAGLAQIDAIEIKVPPDDAGPGFIDAALESMPEELYPFFEIPLLPALPGQAAPDHRGLIASLSGADAGAKVRTGGLTPAVFPAPSQVAEFLLACAAADVPFKATAGLHHAVRSHYPLTYEPDCPRGVMHGFLNVFLAAVLVRTHRAPGVNPASITRLLEETNPAAFAFSSSVVNWNGFGVTIEQIAMARESFALSYGSCSFTEPRDELIKLGILD